MNKVWFCHSYDVNCGDDYTIYGSRASAIIGWRSVVDELKAEFQCRDDELDIAVSDWSMSAVYGGVFYVTCTLMRVME